MYFTQVKRRRATLVLVSFILVCATAVTFAARSKDDAASVKARAEVPATSNAAPATTKDGVAPPQQEQQAATQSDAQKVEVEVVTVTHDGFTPKVIRRPPGPFMLLIENQSGEELDALRLDPEDSPNAATHLLQAVLHKEGRHAAHRLELPAGAYVFRQADRVGWSCRIVIDPELANQ